ncbi:hypothetical protein GCM10009613_14050 [Pseudonocardia kongjuensis]|uniref:Uncharacterized protein n=1 Tax=Pseudonocardia kongjuensis TaxID=102227 RepID=A0ABN1XL17_9PSEU
MVQARRIDPAQRGQHGGDLGQLGAAVRAAVQVCLQRRRLVAGQAPERVVAERLAQGPVLVRSHGSTPISSIASRNAFSP